jgi:hypothetical protein
MVGAPQARPKRSAGRTSGAPSRPNAQGWQGPTRSRPHVASAQRSPSAQARRRSPPVTGATRKPRGRRAPTARRPPGQAEGDQHTCHPRADGPGDGDCVGDLADEVCERYRRKRRRGAERVKHRAHDRSVECPVDHRTCEPRVAGAQELGCLADGVSDQSRAGFEPRAAVAALALIETVARLRLGATARREEAERDAERRACGRRPARQV